MRLLAICDFAGVLVTSHLVDFSGGVVQKRLQRRQLVAASAALDVVDQLLENANSLFTGLDGAEYVRCRVHGRTLGPRLSAVNNYFQIFI